MSALEKLESLKNNYSYYQSEQLPPYAYPVGISTFLVSYWGPRLIAKQFHNPSFQCRHVTIFKLYNTGYKFFPSFMRFVAVTLPDNAPLGIFVWLLARGEFQIKHISKLKTAVIITLASKLFEVIRTICAAFLDKMGFETFAEILGPRDFYQMVERQRGQREWNFKLLSGLTLINFNKDTEKLNLR